MISGGSRSFSISLFRLRHLACVIDHDIRVDSRIVKALDGILDPLGPGSERASRQLSRARKTLEFRNAFRLLSTLCQLAHFDEWGRHLPQQGKHPRHATNGQNLVLDDLSAFGIVFVFFYICQLDTPVH